MVKGCECRTVRNHLDHTLSADRCSNPSCQVRNSEGDRVYLSCGSNIHSGCLSTATGSGGISGSNRLQGSTICTLRMPNIDSSEGRVCISAIERGILREALSGVTTMEEFNRIMDDESLDVRPSVRKFFKECINKIAYTNFPSEEDYEIVSMSATGVIAPLVAMQCFGMLVLFVCTFFGASTDK